MKRLSPAEIAAQHAGSTRIAPGIWADSAGDLHFSIPELLELFGWPDNEEHREGVRQAIRASLAENYPGVPIIDQEPEEP